MAGRLGTFTVDDFTGGLNTRDDPFELPVNEFPTLRDYLLDGRGGGLIERLGDQAYQPGQVAAADSTLAAAVMPLSRGHYSPRLNLLYVLSGSGRIVQLPGPGSISIVGAIFTPTAANASKDASFVDGPYNAAGIDPVATYFRVFDAAAGTHSYKARNPASLTTWTASSGVRPDGLWLASAGNRVWILESTTAANRNRIWWSDLGDGFAWPAQNTMQLDPGDGQVLTGAVPWGQYLVVFKTARMWRIYDLDTGANQLMANGIGCVSADLMCATPDGVVFIDASRGPMITDGNSITPLPNGDKLEEWRHFGKIAYSGGHIYATPDNTSAPFTDWVADYDVKAQAWLMHTSSPTPQGLVTLGPLNRVLLLRRTIELGNPAIDDFQNAGVRATSPWADNPPAPQLGTPFFDLGAPSHAKRVHRLGLDGHGDLGLAWQADYKAGWNAAVRANDVGQLLSNPSARFVLPGPGVGRSLALQVKAFFGLGGVGLDRTEIHGVDFDYRVRRR